MEAQKVLTFCREQGPESPGRIGVIGVDNDREVCENTRPTLTSIELDFEGAGFRAAEILGRMMAHPGKGQAAEEKYGVKALEERSSTLSTIGTGLRVATACERIRTRACSGLTVKEVAAESGLTVRTLELAFRKTLSLTVRDEILRVRLAEARRLLVHTGKPVGEIVTLSGFRTRQALEALFSRRFGLSMRAFRSRAHAENVDYRNTGEKNRRA